MITKRNARRIRAGIIEGRKFVALARVNPGLTSADIGGDLRGLYGEAYSHTVLRAPRDKFVRIANADPLLGQYQGGFFLPGGKDLPVGTRVEHEGRSGAVIHVDAISPDSDLVALVEWDESPEKFEVSLEPLTVAREDERLARAWDEGWHAHYLEWERQREDPTHPITSTNPYRTAK